MGRYVTVESDPKPLEAIMKKPLHVAPLRLQRMLVQLQRFPGITVVYKRGESLHLADALSRAHLEEYLTNAEQLDINLVEHQMKPCCLAVMSANFYCVERPENFSGLQRDLNPRPRDTGAIL